MKTKIIIGIISIITVFAILQCTSTDTPVVSNSDHTLPGKIESSPQYKDGKFNDMGNALNMPFTDFVSTTWEFLFSKNQRTPDTELPVRRVDLSHFKSRGSDQLSVTWLGHSSLMINIDGYRILTDPVFEKRVSILGPTRFNGTVPVDVEQLAPIDVVVISHDHYDHLDRFTVETLAPTGALFVTSRPAAHSDRHCYALR